MSKLSLRQFAKNVKDAYVEVSGDAETITYGNLSGKIADMSVGGGSDGIAKAIKLNLAEVLTDVSYTLVPNNPETSAPANWDTTYNTLYYVLVNSEYVLNSDADWDSARTTGIYVKGE